MQLFGTSINIELGNMRFHFSVGLDDRTAPPGGVRVEDLPRLELGSK